MIQAVLADDERIILKGLKKLIDWERLGIRITGEAGDGQEALRLIEEKKPQLVVSDIAMPGLSGMEMLHRIREQGLQTEVILVSGYQEFSYAREAVRYGAVDYLLKPVEQEDLYDQFSRLNISVEGKAMMGAAFRLYGLKRGEQCMEQMRVMPTYRQTCQAVREFLSQVHEQILAGAAGSIMKPCVSASILKLGNTYVAKALQSGAIKAFTKGFSVLGLIMTGAMTARYVSFKTTFTADFGGTAFNLQHVLDQILPGLLPLLLTLGTFAYLRKKNKPVAAMVFMFAASVVLTLLVRGLAVK